MFKILVAEDEKNIRLLIKKTLEAEGYEVVDCSDGKMALYNFERQHFDLIVTDIMMPFMDGNQLVKEIRKITTDIPILMLTALETIEDKQHGFDNGTDDYLVKATSMRELVMRVKALLKRYKNEVNKQIEFASVVLNFDNNSIKIAGETIELPKKQFLLLFKLLSNPNKIFSRDQLMDEIWGMGNDYNDRTVDTHISWLKTKTKCEDFEIITVRGIGYKAVIK